MSEKSVSISAFPKKVGRPRVHVNGAARQKAYRNRKDPEVLKQERRACRIRRKAREAVEAQEDQWLAVLKYHNDSRGRLPGEFNNFEDLEAIWAANQRDLNGGRVTAEGWGLGRFEQSKTVTKETQAQWQDKHFSWNRRRKETCPASFHKLLKTK